MENNELEKKIDTLANYTKASIESISSYLVLFNKKFEQFDAHFKNIENDIAIIKTEIRNLDGNTNSNFQSVDIKLDDIDEKISQIQKVSGFEELFHNMKNLN